MADEESLSSDPDDEEYVPEEDLVSSDCEAVKEPEVDDNDTKCRKRKRAELLPARKKRGGGIALQDKESESDEEQQSEPSSDDQDGSAQREMKEIEIKKADEEKKARIDELWAGFKKDISKSNPDSRTSIAVEKAVTKTKVDATQSKTVTIRKTFDFAGEDVVVEQQVKADSKEAINFTRLQQQQRQQPQTSSLQSSSKQPAAAGLPSRSKPAVLGATALLQSLNKKPKISTLEKSRLDWNQYKMAEGIEEELQFHSKDGYLEKKEFLERADLRQFEQERNERLKRFKKLY